MKVVRLILGAACTEVAAFTGTSGTFPHTITLRFRSPGNLSSRPVITRETQFAIAGLDIALLPCYEFHF